MKILITGGLGFLGSNLAKEAIKNNFELFILDNMSRVGSEKNYLWLKDIGNFTFFNSDIRNQNDVEEVVSLIKPDHIFHLAGQVAMTTSISNPRKDFEINALGTFNILESIRKYSPGSSIIYSSTNKVYGDLNQFNYKEGDFRYFCEEKPNGFDENVALDFHSPYGSSKGAADQYILDYSRMFDIKGVVLRHSSMYGGRQFSTADQGWIGWFCLNAVQQKHNTNHKFDISGNGKQVRDVLFTTDMIDLYFLILKNIDTVRGQAFNIGGGSDNSLSLLELFNYLNSTLSMQLEFSKKPPRESDQLVFIANIEKIKKFTGWEPKISWTDGINKMLDWVSSYAK